jgi:hypothetical protein
MYASGEAVAMLHAKLEHNGRGAPVAWQRVAPQDLPGLEDGEPTYALILRERRNAPVPVANTPLPTGAPATAADGGMPAPVVSPAPAGVTAATATSSSATPATVPPEAATATAATTAAPAAPAPGASVQETPPPPVAATAPTTANPAPAESPVEPAASDAAPTVAAPSTAPAATPVPAQPAHLAAAGVAALSPEARARIKVPSNAAPVAPSDGLRAGMPLEWPQLLTLRGRMVRIWTMHNPPRTVEILSGEGNALRVVTRVGGGNAEYTIQREAFLRASLIR